MPAVLPYEVLNISPAATVSEIMSAYQRALREQRYSRAEVTLAFNELRNPRRRVEYDLKLYCDLGDADQIRQVLEVVPAMPLLPSVEGLLPIAVAGIDGQSIQDDFLPVPDLPLQFQDSNADGAVLAVLPPIPLPL